MKAILLPTDFSNNSVNAIHYAMRLFKDERCEFYILNIQKASSFISDDMLVMSSTATLYNTLVEAAKKSINNLIVNLKKQFKNDNHIFHALVDYDNFVDSVNQITTQHKIDLIVMGTHGASGLKKMLFGSNTVHVIKRSKVPVLVIPDKCRFKNLDEVGFTTSFKSKYEEQDFKFLRDLLVRHKSHLFVMHVIQSEDTEIELNDNVDFFKLNFDDVSIQRIPNHKDSVYNGIHEFADAHKLKLIVMLAKTHGFLNRLFSEYRVETFAFKIDLPLLVLKQVKSDS
ncbi:universal stress protein [Gaetbulibacter aestuarii]